MHKPSQYSGHVVGSTFSNEYVLPWGLCLWVVGPLASSLFTDGEYGDGTCLPLSKLGALKQNSAGITYFSSDV